MTTKRCAYRGCGSFTTPARPSPETFFAFPKNPVRYKIWQNLGGCEGDLPNTMRYFCSKHFDEAKYIAHNQRRKQLLSTAVPWPYNQSPQREILSDEVDFQCVVSTINDNDNDDDADTLDRFQDDASVDNSNEIANVSDSIDDALHTYDDEFTIAVITEKKSKKRKMEISCKQEPDEIELEPSNRNCSSNRATSSTVSAVKEVDLQEDDKDIEEIDDAKLIESSELTTFIYRGEEYIQMPKEDYLSEKRTLIKRLRAYEDILKNVKLLVDKV